MWIEICNVLTYTPWRFSVHQTVSFRASKWINHETKTMVRLKAKIYDEIEILEIQGRIAMILRPLNRLLSRFTFSEPSLPRVSLSLTVGNLFFWLGTRFLKTSRIFRGRDAVHDPGQPGIRRREAKPTRGSRGAVFPRAPGAPFIRVVLIRSERSGRGRRWNVHRHAVPARSAPSFLLPLQSPCVRRAPSSWIGCFGAAPVINLTSCPDDGGC